MVGGDFARDDAVRDDPMKDDFMQENPRKSGSENDEASSGQGVRRRQMSRRLLTLGLAGAVVAVAAFPRMNADAGPVLCLRNKKLIVREGECKPREAKVNLAEFGALGPQGPQGPAGADGARGPAGPEGPMGEDGQLRIYGDGWAETNTVSANEDWRDAEELPANLQFTDFTVDPGVTLHVPSGLVIRCIGTFTNNGTIIVSTAAAGGLRAASGGRIRVDASVRPAHPGVAKSAPGAGEMGDDTYERKGGLGGLHLTEAEARLVLAPGIVGGGGGGASLGESDGGGGGGSFTVLAGIGVVNNGTIIANGESVSIGGGGGGAGGVVILASPYSVTNGAAGNIRANGGAGGDSDTNEGAGGGGGGGIVHLLAPSITNDGAISVAGGSAGTAGDFGSVIALPRAGGGGGGGCGGSGGNGGGVTDDDDPAEASAGGSGFSVQTLVDPTALF